MDATLLCRERICEAKAQLELKLAGSMGDNKEGFFKHVNRKRRTRANIGLILDEDGQLTNKDIGKADKFNAGFTSVFNLSLIHI